MRETPPPSWYEPPDDPIDKEEELAYLQRNVTDAVAAATAGQYAFAKTLLDDALEIISTLGGDK